MNPVALILSEIFRVYTKTYVFLVNLYVHKK